MKAVNSSLQGIQVYSAITKSYQNLETRINQLTTRSVAPASPPSSPPPSAPSSSPPPPEKCLNLPTLSLFCQHTFWIKSSVYKKVWVPFWYLDPVNTVQWIIWFVYSFHVYHLPSFSIKWKPNVFQVGTPIYYFLVFCTDLFQIGTPFPFLFWVVWDSPSPDWDPFPYTFMVIWDSPSLDWDL